MQTSTEIDNSADHDDEVTSDMIDDAADSGDEHLDLLLLCWHPALNRDTRVAALRTVLYLIAILFSVIAGIVIFAQVQRIVSDGQQRVLDNVEAPYLAGRREDSSEEVDPPGATQLVAVVAPMWLFEWIPCLLC